MCFDLDSSPPIPIIKGAAVSHEDLTLEAADGNRFAAFAATPDEPTGLGVVILPDVRGLHGFYKELAVRFAEAGFEAVAFDYFGRTATDDDRSDSFEYQPHVQQTTPEEFEEFTARMRAQGVEVESHTYPGAPHSFFDRMQEQYKEASDDAWMRILDFTERHARTAGRV